MDEALRGIAVGRTLVVGLGNPIYGDDGCGVRVAEDLMARAVPDVVSAGTSPERALDVCRRHDTVLFVDAVEMGAVPGTVALMDAREIVSRFPQVSTHKISIGALARCLEGGPSVWLLGVQPDTMRVGHGLSEPVALSARAVAAAIAGSLGGEP